eukprot:c7354_g1_i1.p1 GENE.c7354_g1_i1~~c7354_g1_i1.p1  ORF type:complete len:144 (+),score=48.02 c7354_g1_i1:10-441(+)
MEDKNNEWPSLVSSVKSINNTKNVKERISSTVSLESTKSSDYVCASHPYHYAQQQQKKEQPTIKILKRNTNQSIQQNNQSKITQSTQNKNSNENQQHDQAKYQQHQHHQELSLEEKQKNYEKLRAKIFQDEMDSTNNKQTKPK